MAGDDELAAVWGPDGLATTDPGSIRTVASPPIDAPPDPTPTSPSAVRRSPPVSEPRHAEPPGVSRWSSPAQQPLVPPTPTARRRSARVGIAATALAVLAAVVLAVVVLAPAEREASESDVRAAASQQPTTATTVVSAAADLFHGDDDETTPTTTEPDLTTTTAAPAPSPALAGADRAAAAFSATMNESDCNALWDLLSARTQEFMSMAKSASTPDPKSILCEALTEERPVTRVEGPARTIGKGRAVVPIAADGDVEDISLVLERGTWKVDLVAMQEQDTRDLRPPAKTNDEVQALLQQAIAVETSIIRQRHRFTDDVEALLEADATFDWRAGIAPVDAEAGAVYAQLGASDGSVVCLSAKADNGARFLLKQTAQGTASYAGGEIPTACDPSPLRASW